MEKLTQNIDRRLFIKFSTLALISSDVLGQANPPFVSNRPALSQRKFTSESVETYIAKTKSKIADPEIAWMFENCFPNTLDTTVRFSNNGRPDTFIITGDIDAMWLRDSTAQVWHYLKLVNKDPHLDRLFQGLIHRQMQCVLLDPYANAFNDGPADSHWKTDHTAMKPELHERKWEIDSLCYPIRLAYQYWKQTNKTEIFDSQWLGSAKLIYQTFIEQQRLSGQGSYRFGRTTSWSTDTVPGNGYGNPTKPIGLIHSIFRPSDDATIFPFLIPSNFFAATILKNLSEIARIVYKDIPFADQCQQLSLTITQAIKKYAIYKHPIFGQIIPMEIDGFGNHLLQDDANIPNLLSLPYLGAINRSSQLYINTRKFVLSQYNPYYFSGKAAQGIGSPHTLVNQIWPMSIILRALTSTNDTEIIQQIQYLKNTHANTGFIHESFDKDDASKFTRKWFAWANSLFGELISHLSETKPHILKRQFL
jgi:meiotically up-regulated gene 157 (Mug157) protein